MAEIDISNVISISISSPAITAKQLNLSTIALITNEATSLTSPYEIYRSVDGIAEDYGTNSSVYKQATAIFAQTPNVLTNSGYVVVIPMLASTTVAATSGYAVTQDININNFLQVADGSFTVALDGGFGKCVSSVIDPTDFISVTDGCFTITVNNGSPTEVTDLDFSECETTTDIAAVIQSALTAANLNVYVSGDDTAKKLTFYSTVGGDSSSLVFAAGTTGTNILSASYFTIADTSNGSIVCSGLNFTTANSYELIAGVFNSCFSQIGIALTANVELNHLVFKAGSTGASSSVLIGSDATGTDLANTSYLDTASIRYVSGTDAYSGRERLVDCIKRVKQLTYFHAVIPCLARGENTDQLSDAEILDASDYIETQTMMMFVADNALTCCDDGGLFDIIRGRSNHKTRCIAYFGDTNLSARLCASAYAGRGLCVNFDGAGTALTMQLKELATIDPDPQITETLLAKAVEVGADVYCSISGVSACLSHGANDFFDNVYNDNWLLTALQVAGFNALRNAGTKIAQTNVGIDALTSAYKQVLVQGVNNGCFAPGTWTINRPFGDPELFDNNIETHGFYIYVTPLAEQSQTSREGRNAPFIAIACKRAGAVHKSNVVVYINN